VDILHRYEPRFDFVYNLHLPIRFVMDDVKVKTQLLQPLANIVGGLEAIRYALSRRYASLAA
jgi:hypothetical protein